MCSVAKPIIKQIRDNREALDFFETVSLPAEDEKTQAIIMNFPTVYIHNWQDSIMAQLSRQKSKVFIMN